MGPLTIISATNRLWLEYKSPPESSLSSKSEEIGSETNSVHFDHPNNKGFYASYECSFYWTYSSKKYST